MPLPRPATAPHRPGPIAPAKTTNKTPQMDTQSVTGNPDPGTTTAPGVTTVVPPTAAPAQAPAPTSPTTGKPLPPLSTFGIKGGY